MHFHVQSHQLVHRSDSLCRGHIQAKLVCICVLCCTELYGVKSEGLYFKPTLSERKHKCSGNVDGTTSLFLKLCLVAQLCLNFQHMDLSLPGSSCYADSPDKNTGVGCHALSRYCKMKNVSFIVCVCLLCNICVKNIIKLINYSNT